MFLSLREAQTQKRKEKRKIYRKNSKIQKVEEETRKEVVELWMFVVLETSGEVLGWFLVLMYLSSLPWTNL